MEEVAKSLFNLSAGESLFAALFVALFIYVLFDTNRREKDYIKIIEDSNETIRENNSIIISLTERLKIVNIIHDKVTKIEHTIEK